MPNLLERVKKEQPQSSRLTETESSKTNSSNSTTQKSNQQSKEMDLIQKQSETIKTLKDQLSQSNQEHQTKIAEKDRKIRQLSSENSTLRKELQEKSATIVSLNARIEKLSGSDLQLKNAQEKEQNAQKKLEEAKAIIQTSNKAKAAAERKAREADEARRRAENRFRKLDEEVKRSASEMSKESRDKYYKDYRDKAAAAEAASLTPTLYGIILTILTASQSKALRRAGLRFITGFGKAIATIFVGYVRLVSAISGLGDAMDNGFFHFVVAYILPAAFILATVYGVFRLCRDGAPWLWHRISPYFDTVTLWIVLLLVAVNVIFADLLVDQGVNPFWGGIVMFAVLFVVRIILDPEKWNEADLGLR